MVKMFLRQEPPLKLDSYNFINNLEREVDLEKKVRFTSPTNYYYLDR